MTQLHLNLNLEEIEAAILESDLSSTIKSVIIITMNELMKKERDAYIQAKEYERNDTRISQRNGFYERDYILNIGKITLQVPRTRDGKFSTSLFEKYARMDQALLISFVEMVVQGVSTRRVTEIVEKLIGESVSASFVSKLTKKLDPLVKEWANRPLSYHEYPFVHVDAMYIKVRENRRVISKAVYIATGMTLHGKTEILGFKISVSESSAAWKAFFQELLARGLALPELIISDAHEGLKKAITETFVGTGWQRCLFHFIRNIFSKLPKKGAESFRRKVRAIFKEDTKKGAKLKLEALQDEYSSLEKYEKALETLEDGFEEVTQYYLFKQNLHPFIRTTNRVENINLQIRRREKVIRIFPNSDSAFRLIGAILMDLDADFRQRKASYTLTNVYLEE